MGSRDTFWLAVLIFWTSLLGFMTKPTIDSGNEAYKLIKECQSTLPRDVECVIIAVDEREITKE